MNKLVDSLVSLMAEFQSIHGCLKIAYLFGSQANGVAHAKSDVDVAVLLQDDADALADLFLGDYLSGALGKNVDVVVLNHASPILQHEVVRNGIRLLETSPNSD